MLPRRAASCSGPAPDASASARTRSRSSREAPASSSSSSFAVSSMGCILAPLRLPGQCRRNRARIIGRMPALSQVAGSSSTPRTLAEQLRGWTDEQLSALLEARPDLATPAPHDSSQLAARVVVKASVLRALDGLDALELAVLQATGPGHRPLGDPGHRHLRAGSARAALHAGPRLGVAAASGASWWRPAPAPGRAARRTRCPPARRARSPRPGDPRPPARDGADGRWNGRAGPTADLVATGLLARLDERHVTLPWSVRLALRTRRRSAARRAAGAGDLRARAVAGRPGRRPAPPSSSYAAPSSSSTAGAPIPRRR